ncbi:uncharacterized protein LOC112346569 isoform X1 [Selaginella moellendorffii]|uniref:uncharacterized protein LOC112346569 isoform X1 n=1 Tax=Selaginella moellendorffii TaxID=88036 RepID=UPI000D1C48DD|nr:uncharacterized protein LOC112346569 isoform X1 [Selaginella moellendorffii]|eukprot:XP_024531595.1 uncharacterized protein LOC112346569 isoform X1 [Selaginella moellendorffii]
MAGLVTLPPPFSPKWPMAHWIVPAPRSNTRIDHEQRCATDSAIFPLCGTQRTQVVRERISVSQFFDKRYKAWEVSEDISDLLAPRKDTLQQTNHWWKTCNIQNSGFNEDYQRPLSSRELVSQIL